MKKKKLIYIFTGKRGGFSHFIPILDSLNKKKNIDYKIIASDMHLSKKFGNTVNEIKNYTKKIIKVKKPIQGDSIGHRLSTISSTITEMGKIFSRKIPTYIFLLGDRAEVLGAAIASLHYNVPSIHLYGGDITQGGTDEPTRHAISKLSSIHLVSNKKSYNNLIQLGEEKWRIHNVGLVSLDLFKKKFFKKKNKLIKKYGIRPDKPFVILIQHPVTWEIDQAKAQIHETLKALRKMEMQTLAIYPCSDPGHEAIIEAYKIENKKENFKVFKNIESKDFYSLLKYSELLIGNSSCGITECGYLKKFVIDIGSRQAGRLRGKNVFHVEHKAKKIERLITKVLKSSNSKDIYSDYGEGNSTKKINHILNKKFKRNGLIKKRFVEHKI
tara:strand:- start:6226 stop:7377 length:1152 start_codon:yes stop_codon:yes gene_type:complete